MDFQRYASKSCTSGALIMELSFQKNQISLNYGAYQALKIGFFRDMHQKTVLPGPYYGTFLPKKLNFVELWCLPGPKNWIFQRYASKNGTSRALIMELSFQKNQISSNYGAYQALKIGFFRDMHQKTVLPGLFFVQFLSKKPPRGSLRLW